MRKKILSLVVSGPHVEHPEDTEKAVGNTRGLRRHLQDGDADSKEAILVVVEALGGVRLGGWLVQSYSDAHFA